ncbi:NAD-dependent epimerase/dehydratase family protein [Mucilaginibacter myungsuensis]|uniref:NAD-dependent epimerase/dehydratase family protein n=1 Tax=Mucilaginibacter myungsuensis TaxID=649104 RepID=A0A929PW37_9SPHI|nr:NAD-dependent epimerase/dehydratase family protein [Mucilaginibacter myungsuensis]MBE9662418.1 NAD-dependent epimerase/dehydratase family protein [Mucilaginibacter myungsuensis]MDN3599145.1 NAD-dependent epimerase/dehydratase family protein [Mucilaginibacter myungsuensis]
MGTVKTILLTGATGYLGSKLAEALVNSSYNLVILKRSTSNIKRLMPIERKFRSYDLDANGLDRAFAENQIDCVLHTAASYGRKGESLSDIYQANLVFPVSLLDKCIAYGIKYFLNTGTSLPPSLNTYALSKGQFVNLLEQQPEVKTTNVELQYFYGPGDDNTKFITFILNKILSGAADIDLSEGTQYRDFIYIEDVVSAYLLLLEKLPTQEDQFINVPLGSGQPNTLRNVVEKIKTHANSDIDLKFGAVAMRKGDVMYAKADTQLLTDFGWQPKFDIDSGLIKTINKEKSLII